MIPVSSAFLGRVARIAAATLLLVAVASGLVMHASAVPATTPADPVVSASVEQSATAVPVGGTMSFAADIRLPEAASYVLARLQVRQPSGRLVFQRTQTADNTPKGTTTFSFSRPLEGLGLDPGTYPVSLLVQATVNGSDLTTEVATQLRVYDPSKPPVPVVLVARIHSRPMADATGQFAVDPATSLSIRNDVDQIVAAILSDPKARVTLAIPPITLEDWRRLTSGYTLASGTPVPPSDPVPVAYGATLAGLKQALGTGRLELVTLGYADPNLADLAANKLASDAVQQYDTGLSACFQSLEATPSTGTVPAGECVPSGMLNDLTAHGVRYSVVDSDCARVGKRPSAAGSYPVSGVKMTALVADGPAGKAMSAGESSVAVAGTFARLGTSLANQPFVIRVELNETGPDAASTVGTAIGTLERCPWTLLKLGRNTPPPKGAHAVTFPAAVVKPTQPEFWKAVRNGRYGAQGMLAALGAGDTGSGAAQAQSLVAESWAWSDRANGYRLASAGLAFAEAAYKASNAVFGKIDLSANSITFAGAQGNVPVSIQNNSQKTLSVIVVAKTTGGITVVGNKRTPTTLPPRETFVQIPIDMQSALSGKLTIEVVSGPLVISHQTVTVRRSYLDRLALIGAIVFVLGGILVFIVRRVATAPEIEDSDDKDIESDADDETQRYTDSDSSPDETGER